MKKLLVTLIAVMLIVVSIFAFTACNKSSDVKKIEEKGYFVCGITLYEPMSFANDDGEMTGFDTELAQAVAKDLGLSVKFQVISWDAKFTELNSGAIDCIWNGFTVNEERKANVDFSKSYLNNSQCVVVKASNVSQYATKTAFNGKKGTAESGSAGESVAKGLCGENTFTGVAAQMNAFTEIKSGTSDFAVVDVTLASSIVGKGDYADLAIIDNSIVEIEPEEYAIGFRKGSDFTAKVNASLAKLSKDGTINKIAEKYGLANAVIEIK